MKLSDRDLGMGQPITRRDILAGMGATAASAFVPGHAFADEMLRLEGSDGPYYPPALTGLRGSHVGSFEVAHQLGREGRRDWGSVNEPDAEMYDLIVVGSGVSGLSAAFYYREQHPDARILIIDNHDDFGGHAKRNEFQVAGGTLMTHGGSEILEGPENYGDIANALLEKIGIKAERLGAAYEADFYAKNKLTAGTYFDKETFGEDRTLAYPLVDSNHYNGWISVIAPELSHEDAIRQMPLSDAAKRELTRLVTSRENVVTEHSFATDEDYLNGISYREFLEQHMGIQEPEIYTVFEDLGTDWCVGIEAIPALEAFYWGLPGINATSIGGGGSFGPGPDSSPTYHFPDGNASIARMLVRNLIPDVAPGSTMEDLVLAEFDYSNLDRADSNVRIRLQSTAVHVEHDGALDSSNHVNVTYVQNEQASRVRARHCILACYNQIIPHLCPELPDSQREALKTMVKSPIIYTNVALRNWEAWKNLGVGALLNPGSYFVTSVLDYPADFGGYNYSRNPDEPTVVHMTRFPHLSNAGLTPSEQKVAGRHEVFATPYETIERHVREQLAGSLAPGGFDPARDIEGITVNRWAHAYINRANPLYDEMYEDREDERYPFVRGRKPFGRIAIANSDAGSSSLINIAINQAHRAVNELV
ncbi:MAG: NAD(P)-binding protein [Woeseiaceae bacterium]